MTVAARTVPVTVALAEPLFAAATAPVRPRIEAELHALTRELGLELTPVVEVRADPAPPRGHVVRVEVAGQPCRLPRLAVAEALAYVEGTPLVADRLNPAVILNRLGGAGREQAELLGEWLGLYCRAAVSAQPGVFLPGHPFAAALALGMSVAGRDPDSMRESFGTEHVEDLISQLAVESIGLIVEPAYFRTLTTDGNGGELFSFTREGMFTELGVSVPPMRVQYDQSLRPAGFAFRFNAVRTLPRIGLGQETILVNDTAERLALMNVEGQLTVNPATSLPAAVVARDHKDMLEAAGLTVWDPFGYYILVLASAIRRNAYALITTEAVSAMTGQLARAFPAVTEAAELCEIPAFLAPTLRELLRDRVSIRNLRRILEILVRGETVPEERDDSGWADMVRSGLSDQIAQTLTRETGTLVAYLLDPEIDDAVAGHAQGNAAGWSDETVTEQLCDALHAELAHLPETASIPVVLTSSQLRSTVRARLRHEFPEIAVVGYNDIPDNLNVQPVARISWRS